MISETKVQGSGDEKRCAEKKIKIAVVEDDQSLARIIEIMLRDHYDASVFFSAEDALKEMSELHWDLILTDIHLPGMDGFSFAEKLRSRNETSIIPLVFLSGFDVDATEIEKRMPADYLQKPFSRNELLEVVKRLFSTSGG